MRLLGLCSLPFPSIPEGTEPCPLLGLSRAAPLGHGVLQGRSVLAQRTGRNDGRLVLSSATTCLSVPGHGTQPSLPTVTPAPAHGLGLEGDQTKITIRVFKSSWTSRTPIFSCCPKLEQRLHVPGEGGATLLPARAARAGGFGTGQAQHWQLRHWEGGRAGGWRGGGGTVQGGGREVVAAQGGGRGWQGGGGSAGRWQCCLLARRCLPRSTLGAMPSATAVSPGQPGRLLAARPEQREEVWRHSNLFFSLPR